MGQDRTIMSLLLLLPPRVGMGRMDHTAMFRRRRVDMDLMGRIGGMGVMR